MIARRTFTDYDTYVYAQGLKARTRAVHLLTHLPKNIATFERTFRRAATHLKPGAVLCLGARTGAESIGATAAGFPESVGIDLHPIGPTVLKGDWHDLPCADRSFANVYTNSLDHCLDLDRLTTQVRRVLMWSGRFYVMATNRQTTEAAWRASDSNEALYWRTSDDLRDAICGYGFDVKAEWRDGKWGHYVFGVAR